MKNDIQSILNDLYHVDPSLKSKEEDLKKLIAQLLEAKPHLKVDPNFVKQLKNLLEHEASQLNQTEEEVRQNFWQLLNRTFLPFAGGVLAILIVVVLITEPISFTTQDKAPDELAIEPGIAEESTEASMEAEEMTPPEQDSSIEVATSGFGGEVSTDQISAQVQAIDEGLTTCKKTEMPWMNHSTEGGTATFYEKEGYVRKIKEELLGETGKTVSKYYFVEGELIYVIQEIHHYNRPITDEAFDPEESEIETTEFYFDAQTSLSGEILEKMERSQTLVEHYWANTN